MKVGHVSNDGGFIAFLVNFCFHLHKFINRDFWGVEQEVVYLGLDVCAKMKLLATLFLVKLSRLIWLWVSCYSL